MSAPRAANVRWIAGSMAMVVVLALFLLGRAVRSRPSPHFPGTVVVTFLGSIEPARAGTSSLVGADVEPNVAFRLAVVPAPAAAITVLGVTVFSSDRSGHPAGGGRWDTHTEWTRALAIVREGEVVNGGPKRLLQLEIRRPTVLDAYFADGTMTQFWDYFTVRLEAAGGAVYSTVVKRGAWRMLEQPRGPSTPAPHAPVEAQK